MVTRPPKTWVPIPLNIGRCEKNCCSRQGYPFFPGYAVPIHKSQGLTIGQGNTATHCRIKLQSSTKMESLSLGLTYVALSRVHKESDWALVEPIPYDRISYINSHPHMKGRLDEEKRLQEMSDRTVNQFKSYADVQPYINLLREMDECCDDDILDSLCLSGNASCTCIACHALANLDHST